MKFYHHIQDLLKSVPKYSRDGKLFKNIIVEDGLKLDPDLLKLLLKDARSKKHFFQDVDGITVFDKTKFQKFISNKEFLPDSFTSFSQNIGLNANGKFLTEANEVVLDFPFKDCVLEGGQTKEDQKRKEIFWNETLAPDEIDRLFDPKALTNLKRYDKDGAHEVKEITDTDNLVIKGNNLLALHSLKKKYRGRVKLIYIDPPYNTGSDSFGYNDKFNHSSWLTFMKNRLEVAHSLLDTNGVIMINIDDKEYSYLKILCDDIFHRDNFLNVFTVKTSDPSGHKTVNPSPYSQSEYILLYAKDKKFYVYDTYYISSDYDTGYSQYITNIEDNFQNWNITGLNEFVAQKNGYKDTRDANKKIGKYAFFSIVARFALDNANSIFQPTAIADDAANDIVLIRDKSKKQIDKIFKIDRDDDIIHVKGGRQIYFYSNKLRNIDGIKTPSKPLTNIWTDIPYNGISKEGGVKLKNGKKPEKLIRRVIEISTNENDLILDFHLGSGTTAAVAHKLNRQYIGIEQLDYGKNDSIVRLQNVINGDTTGISKVVNWQGGGSFVYAELAKNNQNYIDRIQAADSDKELRELYKELTESHLISYKVTPEDLKANNNEFAALSRDDQKRFLIALLDKNELYINYSEIKDAGYKMDKETIAVNEKFYS